MGTERRWTLHEQLGIPTRLPIPMGLLKAIIETPLGQKFSYRSLQYGKRWSGKVTLLLKQRAVQARNARRRGS